MSLDDDEDLKALRRAERRRAWTLRLIIGGLITTFVGMIIWNFTAPMRRRAADRITEAEATEFRARMAKALDVVSSQEADWATQTELQVIEFADITDAECPLDLQPPTTTAIESFLKYGSIDVNSMGNVSFTRVPPGQPFGPCDECASVRRAIDRGLGELEKGELGRRDLRWYERFDSGATGWTIFIVADEWKRPEQIGAAFEPGRVRGHAWLYGHQSRRFVCVTDLDVESSRTVKGYYSARADGLDLGSRAKGMQQAIDFDLEVQVKRAIARTSRFIAEETPRE